MGSAGTMFVDTGVLATVVSGIRNLNRRGGRIPVRGMRTDLTVEPRANRFVFNAVLILAFFFNSFAGCWDVRNARAAGYAARTMPGLFSRTDC
jgi:hypothetical protein